MEQGGREGDVRHRLKEAAVEAGREVARRLKVDRVLHLSDGSIGEKNSYGNDPCPPKDSGKAAARRSARGMVRPAMPLWRSPAVVKAVASEVRNRR